MSLEEFKEITGSEFIQDFFLFKNLNFSEAHELAKICHLKHYKAKDIIIEENSLSQGLYLILNGEVRVVKGEGEEQVEVARLKRGELFGEMSLIENELTSASVIAKTDVDIFMINREEFEDLLDDNERLALKIYKSFCRTLSERLRKTTDELTRIQKESESKKVVSGVKLKSKKRR